MDVYGKKISKATLHHLEVNKYDYLCFPIFKSIKFPMFKKIFCDAPAYVLMHWKLSSTSV
jgi:hypothetical protein